MGGPRSQGWRGPARLLDKPEMEPEALAEVRARLERVLRRWLRTAVCGLSVRVWWMICVFAGGDRSACGAARKSGAP